MGMKRILLAALATTAAAVATPSSAAVVIGIGFNGGTVTQVATDAGTGSASYIGLLNGYFFNLGGAGAPLLGQPDLLTQSLNIAQTGAAAGTINIYITQTDQNASAPGVTSTFTSNTISNATATLSSYYSAANALFGGTRMQSATFADMGVFRTSNALALTGPYSTTVRYDLTFGNGGGNFNGTANLTGVPEPASWALMLFGFGSAGYALRRRKAVGARIRFA